MPGPYSLFFAQALLFCFMIAGCADVGTSVNERSLDDSAQALPQSSNNVPLVDETAPTSTYQDSSSNSQNAQPPEQDEPSEAPSIEPQQAPSSYVPVDPQNQTDDQPEPPSEGSTHESHGGVDGEFTWSGRHEGPGLIELHNVVGDITLLPTNGDQIEVVATKTSNASPIDSVTFEVVTDSDGVLICVIYPEEPGGTEQICTRDRIQLSNNDNDVVVQFEARIPRHMNAVATTVNGHVLAENLESAVYGRSVNGDVSLNTSSLASAESVSGNIEVNMGDPSLFLTSDEGLSFQTVNGSVSVTVPAESSFDFAISTVLGRLDTPFPHEMFGGQIAEGRAGAGGPIIELSSVNGDAELLQSP